jgi:hypothetical protein
MRRFAKLTESSSIGSMSPTISAVGGNCDRIASDARPGQISGCVCINIRAIIKQKKVSIIF